MKQSKAGGQLALGGSVENVSPTELYNVMTSAASQDPQLVQASSKRFKEMLEMPGTYDALYEIASERSVPLPVRQQCIIQFKNNALSHWRSRKLLSDEQRVRIRTRCLLLIEEEDDIIADCNEIIVAKISRQDYPHNWPNLVTDLMSAIEANLQLRYMTQNENHRATLVLRRSLQLLNAILKEFASVKMPSGIKIMSQIVQQLHLVLYGYYSKISPTFASSTSLTVDTISSLETTSNILIGHLLYKCLVKMAVWVWQRNEKMPKAEFEANYAWFQTLFQSSTAQIRALTELRRTVIIILRQSGRATDMGARRSIDILTRHIRLIGKFFRRLQQLLAARFVGLPACNDLVLYYWSQVVEATNGVPDMIYDSNDALFPVRFLVQAMVLFRDSLAQWAPMRKDGTVNNNTLSREFVENAVRLLVTRFMPLNPADLQNWMADPEEWVNLEDKENDQWEYELRPCSERVLVTLASQYREYVTALLDATFKQIATRQTVDLDSVIQKEALYCAIGRCAIRLKNVIPFDEWLEQTLAVEARDTNPNFPIIKRRIAWLIGKWIGDECSSPNNPVMWQVLAHLLQDRGSGTDTVVRLTAAVALKECVDTVIFDVAVFKPFLASAVAELIRLIGEAETLESKRRVASTLNVIIERAEAEIIPFIGTITEPLPHLWLSAGEDWLLKSSLLVIVKTLIDSVGKQSTSLSGIVVPLVRESISPEAALHLDEDGLNLWLSALRHTTIIESVNGTAGLIELLPLALSVLATNLDLLGKMISIVESYILLDGERVLQVSGVNFFQAFLTALKSDAVLVNMKDMIVALNLAFQITPSALWGEALHISGLFAYLIHILIDGEKPTTFLTEVVLVMARLALADRQLFLQLMSITARTQNATEADLYDGLLDQWWNKFDNMSEPRHRKLAAMGIASLVSTGRPEVLKRLPGEIFNLWLDVFGEIKEALTVNERTPQSSPSLHRFWDLDEAPVSYFQGSEGTAEYERRRAVFLRDPLHTVQLSQFVAGLLREAEAGIGAQQFQALYLSQTDPTVLKQIHDELMRT